MRILQRKSYWGFYKGNPIEDFTGNLCVNDFTQKIFLRKIVHRKSYWWFYKGSVYRRKAWKGWKLEKFESLKSLKVWTILHRKFYWGFYRENPIEDVTKDVLLMILQMESFREGFYKGNPFVRVYLGNPIDCAKEMYM